MIRIAFFLTMPISRNTPISAMIENSMREQQQRQHRADAGRRQGRQHRDRMYQALVEHAEDDVDHDDARRGSGTVCCPCDCCAASAVPWNEPRTAGRHADVGLGLLDRRGRVVQRLALGEVERDRRRELGVLVVDRASAVARSTKRATAASGTSGVDGVG